MVRLHRAFGGRRGRFVVAAGLGTAAVVLAACGSASSSPTSTSSGTAASVFSVMNVSGLGQVLVDGNERTVYVLTSGAHKNVPCASSNGCTNVWPNLPLTGSTAAPKAGNGIEASMLGTMKLSDGKTYPTYNGWLVYEYTGDSGPGQAAGQGISSYGGTWYVLGPSGNPIKATPTSSSGGGSSGGGSSGGGSSGGTGY
jgi:predicted lipoprotein with Yx(FWY)xxD motif